MTRRQEAAFLIDAAVWWILCVALLALMGGCAGSQKITAGEGSQIQAPNTSGGAGAGGNIGTVNQYTGLSPAAQRNLMLGLCGMLGIVIILWTWDDPPPIQTKVMRTAIGAFLILVALAGILGKL